MADRTRRLLVAVVSVVLLLAVAGSVATYRLTSDEKAAAARVPEAVPTTSFEVRGAAVEYSGDDGTLIACGDGDGTLSSLPSQPVVQVVVRDATSRVVALGSMQPTAEVVDVTCTRAFSVADVPAGLRFYELELGGRDLGWFTEAQLRQFVAVGGSGAAVPVPTT